MHQVADLPFQLMDDLDEDESTEENSLRITRNGKKITDHQVMNPQENSARQGGKEPAAEAPIT